MINIKEHLYAMRQRNLVYNCDFRYFSNQYEKDNKTIYGIPDGWQYKDSGEGENIEFDAQKNEFILTKGDNNSPLIFKQAVHEFPRWRDKLLGKTITSKFSVSVHTEGSVTFTLSDGVDTTTKTKEETGSFEIEIQHDVSNRATKVYLSIETSTPKMVIRLTRVIANIGLISLDNLPCMVEGTIGERKQYVSTQNPPAEELSLCVEPIELNENQTRLDSVLNARFGVGANNRSKLIDMRGYFSRAWNNGSDIDPNAATRTSKESKRIGDYVGTFEKDAFLQHNHELNFSTNKQITMAQGSPVVTVNNTITSHTSNTPKNIEDGQETRPKNISELYTIKWA